MKTKNLKYLIIAIILGISFSCSNDDDKNIVNKTKREYVVPADYEVTLSVSGDIDKTSYSSCRISGGTSNVYDQNNNNLGVYADVDLKKGKFKYSSKKSSMIMVNFIVRIDDKYINDPNVQVKVGVIIKMNGKIVENEIITYNKDNSGKQYAFQKYKSEMR